MQIEKEIKKIENYENTITKKRIDNTEILSNPKRLKKERGKLAVLKSSEDNLVSKDFSEKRPVVNEDKQPAKKQKFAQPHGGHGVFEQSNFGHGSKISSQHSSGDNDYDEEGKFPMKK